MQIWRKYLSGLYNILKNLKSKGFETLKHSYQLLQKLDFLISGLKS